MTEKILRNMSIDAARVACLTDLGTKNNATIDKMSKATSMI